jgi:hypothetical protein
MEDLEQKIVLIFPEVYFGEVMGKLCADGASPIDAHNDDGEFTIKAIYLKSKLTLFEQWFKKITCGKGVINFKM